MQENVTRKRGKKKQRNQSAKLTGEGASLEDLATIDIENVDLGWVGSGDEEDIEVGVVDDLAGLGTDVQEAVLLEQPGIVIGHLKRLVVASAAASSSGESKLRLICCSSLQVKLWNPKKFNAFSLHTRTHSSSLRGSLAFCVSIFLSHSLANSLYLSAGLTSSL